MCGMWVNLRPVSPCALTAPWVMASRCGVGSGKWWAMDVPDTASRRFLSSLLLVLGLLAVAGVLVWATVANDHDETGEASATTTLPTTTLATSTTASNNNYNDVAN